MSNTTQVQKTQHQTKKDAVLQLAEKIKAFGYNVYLSGNKEYGFFANNEGTRLVCFQCDYFFFSFSSNHKGVKIGSGAGLTDNEQCLLWKVDNFCTAEFLNSLITAPPYRCNSNQGEKFISWTTLEQHLATYGSSSKYEQL